MLRGLARLLVPSQERAGSNLRELVFGYNDGLVTTFTVVVGFTGAALSHSIIIIAALITAIADALSMAFGAYLSSKSEREQFEAVLRAEREKVRDDPASGKSAITEHLTAYGLTPSITAKAAEQIARDEERMTRIIVRDLRGLEPNGSHSPLRDSVAMFFAFLFGSLFPITPFLIGAQNPFVLSVTISIISAFSVGAYKTKVTKRNWIASGAETMSIAVLLMIISFTLGVVISGVV